MNKIVRYLSFMLIMCVLLSMASCGQTTATEDFSKLPEGVSYGIKVVNSDGEPIVGAMVALCQNVEGGTCYMPTITDENGMAYFYANIVPVQNNMKFRVLAAEGYELPLDETGDIRYTVIPDGTVQMIILLNKIEN